MKRKSGDKIEVGDELITWFNGGRAVVKTLRPYDGVFLSLLGEGTQIASFRGINLEMTLSAKGWYEVAE